MKKIAILLKNYIPYNDAITFVINPTIKELCKNNKIDIFCVNRNIDFKCDTQNLKVIRVWEKSKIKWFLSKLFLKFFNYDKNRILFWNKYKKTVKKYCKKEKYDLVISTSCPFCNHELASQLKKKYNIKWIAYQFDPYSLNNIINNKKRKKYEKKVLSMADYIFLPEEYYNEYIKSGFDSFENKYKIFYFPIINMINHKETNDRIVFAGAFYENFREPIIPVKILKDINLNNELDIFYTCSNKLSDRIKKELESIEKVNLIRNAKKVICDKAINESKYLLNIGNKNSNQTPSKVFEYMSYGKPIINFYHGKSDTSYKVLKNYPLAINIDINSYNIAQIRKEILEKSKSIAFEEIKKHYPKECNFHIKTADFINKI